MQELEKYIEEALENIHSDRKVTNDLLKDVMRYLATNDANHEKVGPVAAKYVETLQRSNEQLVKIAALLQKQAAKSEGLTTEDKDELFDMIQETKQVANDDPTQPVKPAGTGQPTADGNALKVLEEAGAKRRLETGTSESIAAAQALPEYSFKRFKFGDLNAWAKNSVSDTVDPSTGTFMGALKKTITKS